jgi:hypothetical protein
MTNTEMLRAAIDHGKGGSKVRGSDPAAAPIGTDDEAAGTPPNAHQVDTAMAHESSDPKPKRRYGALIFYVLAIVGIAAIFGAALTLGR